MNNDDYNELVASENRVTVAVERTVSPLAAERTNSPFNNYFEGDNNMLRVILSVTLIALALFGMTNVAQASSPNSTFMVNSNLDVGDNNPGDGICFIGIGFELCSLRAAIEEANAVAGSDEILFDLSDYSTIDVTNGALLITTPMTIDASDVVGLDIEGNGNAAIFEVNAPSADVTISDLTISDTDFSGDYGAGVLIEAGNVEVRDSTLRDLSTVGCGAAMRLTGGSADIVVSEFRSNHASLFSGGAICSEGSEVNLSGSFFVNNEAKFVGGAVYVSQNNLSVLDTSFLNNELNSFPGHGGAIFVDGGDFTFEGSGANSNIGSNGGAIYLYDSIATITDSTIGGNSKFNANGCGAGVYAEDGTLTIDDSLIWLNVSQDNHGGGLCAINNDITVNNSTFSLNDAGDWGGGIYSEGSAVAVTDSMFTDNSASSGGGIYLLDSPSTITDSTFDGNVANNSGGGMYSSNSTAQMERVQWLNNYAVDTGGGLYISGTGVLRAQLVSGNQSSFTGGGMAVVGLTVERSLFVDNSADTGGGLRLQDGTLNNSTVTNNSADYGAGILALGTSTSINHATIAHNVATIAGGGLLVSQNATANIQNSIIAHHFNGDCFLGDGAVLQAVGANLDTDSSCPTFSHPNQAPLLTLLADNGGFTQTLLPNPASPVVNAAAIGGCAAVGAVDQRWFARTDGQCDLGAVEVAGAPTAVTLSTVTTSTKTTLTGALSLTLIALTAGTALFGRNRSKIA